MMRSEKRNKNIRKFAILIFWFVVWFGIAEAVDNQILLVTPLEAFGALVSRLGQGSFYLAVGRSLLRVGSGFLAGAAAALLLAVGSWRLPLLEDVLAPVLNLMKAIPVASFVVLFLIWWGSSFLSVAICFLVVLPQIYISTLEGLKSTDKRLLEMAQVFRFSFWSRFFYIYRPALKPFLYSSLKISLGMCWKSGIAAEVIGTPESSVGEQMYLSKIYLDTAGVFAWTAVIVLLSVLFEKIILWLAGMFFAWEPECKGQLSCETHRRRVIGVNCPYGKPEGDAGRSKADGKTKAVVEDGAEAERRREVVVEDGTGAEKGRGAVAEDGTEAEERTEAVAGSGTIVRKMGEVLDDGSIAGKTGESAGDIRCEGVIKSFGGERVLDQVSVTYRQGRTYYLTSPSGSGKTTLLRILAGLTAPDGGWVEASFDCGMVFQEDRLCEDYSAVKNVALVTGERGRAEEALRQLLEEEALHKPCSQLSGGMKRRVALVRAMESESAYILLDEPFTGMDILTKERVEAYIRRRQKGRTLIIATHI